MTGRGSTDDISDANVLIVINDYYQEDFPFDIDCHQYEADYTQAVTAVDSGIYTLANTVLDLNEPIRADDSHLRLVHDAKSFFESFPLYANENFTTPPTLAIGTSSTTKVKNAAFTFKIGNVRYSKATAETALSGDNVPVNTYGAWLVYVDEDGTISVSEAADNATGYATAALAVRGLVNPGASYAIMGYVTAISSSGVFDPGTTALDNVNVTDTYTDGDPGLRNIPAACCITGGNLHIRPRPNDSYMVRASASLSAPTALVAGTSPADETHGPAIATGAAIKWLTGREGSSERIGEILGAADQIGSHRYNINRINRKRIFQESDRQADRSW